MTPAGIEAVAAALQDNPTLGALSVAQRKVLARHMALVTYPAGAIVIRRDAVDQAMYLVVNGRARVTLGDMDLGPIERGEHFGEVELIDGQPRSATVRADTDLALARLDAANYAALTASDPHLGLVFVRAILGEMALRLRATTENLRALATEGRVPRRPTRVTVRTAAGMRTLRTGTPIGELLPATVNGHPVVAGLVGRRAHSLTWRMATDSTIEPLSTEHWEGKRIFRTSLGLLLLEAAHRVDPSLSLRQGHSVGFAQRVHILNANGRDRVGLARELEAAMHALVAADLQLSEEVWRVEEARELIDAAGWEPALSLLRTWREPNVALATYGEVRAFRFLPLIPRTGMLGGFHVVPDEPDGLLIIYGRYATSPNDPGGAARRGERLRYPTARLSRHALATSRQSRALTQEPSRWLEVLGIRSVGEFNLRCIDGNAGELIRVVEGYHEKRIGQIADAIAAHGDVKVVCVAGPSSSGKTTFIKRLKVQLEVVGITPRELSLDNYYVDRKDTPKDADGEYDYEAFEALRAELLGDHLRRLLAGEVLQTAKYDFKTGTSLPDGGPQLHLDDRDLLLLEGIHGLNPKLLDSCPEAGVFRIFLCPLAQLPFDRLSRVHASDVRLLRRIVRDRHRRGSSAADNIARWPSVRRGERVHIFPFQYNADEVFDSSLIYELSVLKVFAERYLLEVPQDHPSYITAFRLLQLLDQHVAIYPDHVPPTSLLREFIGGSGFKY